MIDSGETVVSKRKKEKLVWSLHVAEEKECMCHIINTNKHTSDNKTSEKNK